MARYPYGRRVPPGYSIIHFSTFDCNVIPMEACLQHSFVLAGLAACQPLCINKALYESEPSMYTQSMPLSHISVQKLRKQ